MVARHLLRRMRVTASRGDIARKKALTKLGGKKAVVIDQVNWSHRGPRKGQRGYTVVYHKRL